MKLTDVIDKVSTLYRDERQRITEMRHEVMTIQDEFVKANETDWENMTVARRNKLHTRNEYLRRKIEQCSNRAEGISDVREMLLDLLDNGEELED